MSEIRTLSEAQMKRKIDNGSAKFTFDGESIMVWVPGTAYQYRLYSQKYASDGSPNGWVTDGSIRFAPYRNPNAPILDSSSDTASFASASSGSSENKVAGDDTKSYLTKIASDVATGATNLAVNGLTTAAKNGAKGAAVIAGTAALSEALKHPEYFPDKLQPLVPIADVAVNKIGKTVGKTILGVSKNIAWKYGPAIAKAAARAGWNNIILPRIIDYWNSVEPWLPLMIGAPIAAYGATKTVGSGLNLIKSGVESGTQAIMRVLKPTRIEEPIDFNEKDNISSSSSSSSWPFYNDRTVEQYLKDNPSELNRLKVPSLTDGKSSSPSDGKSYLSLTDGKSSDSSLALVSAESELTDDPWASSDSIFDDSSFYSDASEFIPPLPPAGGSGSLGGRRRQRRVIFLSFFRLKI